LRGFITELLSEYEQIAGNQVGRLEPGLSEGEVIDRCRKITENIRALRADIENILKTRLYPLLDGIKDVSDEDEADLFAAAQKISSYEARLDPGLALSIYQKLLCRARGKKDDDEILKYLYWCGITLYFLKNGQNEKILDYFEEGASYAGKYHSFAAPETRKYIHRCLANKSMMLYATDRQREAAEADNSNFSFWNSLIFSGADPDFPWFNYFFSCLNYKYLSISHIIHNDPDSETKETLKKILDTAISIHKVYTKNRESFSLFGGTRYEIILWEAQFLSGLISFEQMRENIAKVKAQTTPGDYSANALYVNIDLDSYLIFYATKMQRLKNIKDEVVSSCMKDVIKYFSSLPMTVKPSEVSYYLQIFVTDFGKVFGPGEQIDFILKMTTFRHIPMYAHSIMVGKLASRITELLAEVTPECFVGCMGITEPGEARRRAGELCRFIETASLCHDIGKITYVGNPFMHARVLTDDELEIVTRHPLESHKMMAREDGSPFNEGYSDIARGHHKYYDNSGGYPEDFDTSQSKYKIMIDIVAAADAIDLATDDVGVNSADVKSFDEAADEITAGAGTKYSPVAASLFGDAETRASLARILREERAGAYYTAYLHAWS